MRRSYRVVMEDDACSLRSIDRMKKKRRGRRSVECQEETAINCSNANISIARGAKNEGRKE
jgi:hypothetical protein